MYNYEHKKLIQSINKLDEVPDDSQAFSAWLQAEGHLKFLRENAQADDLVICASSRFTFVNSVVVPNSNLSPVDHDDLMGWSFNPHTSSIASYVTGGGREGVWVERGLSCTGAKTLDDAVPLIFGRTFEGWSGPRRDYYELNQEYAHLVDLHWRPEKRAYCRYEQGDLEPVVSITTDEDKESDMNLVSFKWEPLEEYLAASDASLVRMFDFTLLRRSVGFGGWSKEPPQKVYESDQFFYRRKVMPGHAAYTRGVQIIRPRRSEKAVFTGITDRWTGQKNKKYAEFLAIDWRNDRIARISTDPKATTNYFDAKGNSLPFELSPAFFKPEVLSKYKTDRDKYTVGEREVSCRAAWYLRGIDVNEAGQVHAYICYLRNLPYTEQLHWFSYNEPPKAGISKRACVHDFKGEWANFTQPLQKVLSIVRRWHDEKVAWWTLRDVKLLERVNTPLTASKDEWAEAFMDLAKLVVEGFETRPIRTKLDSAHLPYEKQDRTIALLEKLMNKGDKSPEDQRLTGLRTVQLLRSEAKGHVGGSEAEQLAQEALMEHETFGNHFQHVCSQVADDLETVEQLIS